MTRTLKMIGCFVLLLTGCEDIPLSTSSVEALSRSAANRTCVGDEVAAMRRDYELCKQPGYFATYCLDRSIHMNCSLRTKP